MSATAGWFTGTVSELDHHLDDFALAIWNTVDARYAIEHQTGLDSANPAQIL